MLIMNMSNPNSSHGPSNERQICMFLCVNCFRSVPTNTMKYMECSMNLSFMWGTHASMMLWDFMLSHATIHSPPFFSQAMFYVYHPQLTWLYMQRKQHEGMTWASCISRHIGIDRQHVLNNIYKISPSILTTLRHGKWAHTFPATLDWI